MNFKAIFPYLNCKSQRKEVIEVQVLPVPHSNRAGERASSVLDIELKRVLVRIVPQNTTVLSLHKSTKRSKPSWCSLGHSHTGCPQAQSCQTEARSPNCVVQIDRHCSRAE